MTHAHSDMHILSANVLRVTGERRRTTFLCGGRVAMISAKLPERWIRYSKTAPVFISRFTDVGFVAFVCCVDIHTCASIWHNTSKYICIFVIYASYVEDVFVFSLLSRFDFDERNIIMFKCKLKTRKKNGCPHNRAKCVRAHSSNMLYIRTHYMLVYMKHKWACVQRPRPSVSLSVLVVAAASTQRLFVCVCVYCIRRVVSAVVSAFSEVRTRHICAACTALALRRCTQHSWNATQLRNVIRPSGGQAINRAWTLDTLYDMCRAWMDA